MLGHRGHDLELVNLLARSRAVREQALLAIRQLGLGMDVVEEQFRRMVFNAMVTNNDDHPRNHALVHTTGGWRLSPAYDILPVPMVSIERRDLALEVGRFGRAASLYNILSHCDAFGLSKDEARALIDAMLAMVRGWREFFIERGVEPRSIEMLEQAMLPPSFFRDTPPDAV